MRASLGREVLAEALGTGLLVAVVVGSGIAAERRSPGDSGLQLLENSLATAAGLGALIAAFGAISGAHFNPVVTIADRVQGATTTREAAAYVPAQVLGACVGAVVANLMFDLGPVTLSTHERSGGGLWLGESVASFGLLIVIFGVARSRPGAAPLAVAGYIAAAYWFTSSTSFANPAVTVGRTLTDTFAGIAPASAAPFVAMQFLGAAVAVAVASYLYTGDPGVDLVVPHEHEEADAA